MRGLNESLPAGSILSTAVRWPAKREGPVQRELVERAAKGDQDAFTSLAASCVDRCYALSYRILRDPDQAQDATQQALIGAWRDLPSLRDPERFDAWLNRLVVNACYVELRAERRRAARVRVISLDGSHTPDAAISVADRAALEDAFRSLTPEQRAVVVSHHYLGFPLTEIAVTLGIPVGTARSRLHYAVRQLRAVLDAEAPSAAAVKERSA
jgi:RNA polymerase sigma-70 factor (ECF subfamily)